MATTMDFALFLVDLIVNIILTGLQGALQFFTWAAIYGHFCDALEDLAELHLIAAIEAAATHFIALLRALRIRCSEAHHRLQRALRRKLSQLGRMARSLAILALLTARGVISHGPIALLIIAALAAKTLWCLFIHIGRWVLAVSAVRCILTTVSTTMTKALTIVGCGSLCIPIMDNHGRITAWRQVNVRIGLNVSVVDFDYSARAGSQPISQSQLMAPADGLATPLPANPFLLPPTSAIVSASATDGARGVHVDARAAAVAGARVISLELTQTRPVSISTPPSTSILSAWLLAWHSASLERGAGSSSTSGPQQLLTLQDSPIKMQGVEPACSEITHDDSETASDTADESDSDVFSEPEPTAEAAHDALETHLTPDNGTASEEVDDAVEEKEDLPDSTALSAEDGAVIAVETMPTTAPPAVSSSIPRRTASRPARKPFSQALVDTASASTPTLPRLRVTQVPPSRPAPTQAAARGERRAPPREPLHRRPANSAASKTSRRGNTTRESHQQRRVSVNVPANYDTNQRARVYDFEHSPKWAKRRADALAARAARAN